MIKCGRQRAVEGEARRRDGRVREPERPREPKVARPRGQVASYLQHRGAHGRVGDVGHGATVHRDDQRRLLQGG